MEEAAAEYEKLLAARPRRLRLLQVGLLARARSSATTSPACWRSGSRPEVVKKAYKIIYQFSLGDKETARHQVLARPADGAAGHARPGLRALPGGRRDGPGRPGHRRPPERAQGQAVQQLPLRLPAAQQGHQHPPAAGGAGHRQEDQQERRIRAGGPVQGRRPGARQSRCRCSTAAPSAPSTRRLPVPFELINNLKKSFLLYYVWVPLRWDKTGIEILVDDPKDLRKTDHIRALMGNQKISISVAHQGGRREVHPALLRPARREARRDRGGGHRPHHPGRHLRGGGGRPRRPQRRWTSPPARWSSSWTRSW
ncbi:MAG: hypothetical protein MZU91_01605 [Desulfosudis oleivorans]|nr:hypothetical protein [Desulfosudis oleivorans]